MSLRDLLSQHNQEEQDRKRSEMADNEKAQTERIAFESKSKKLFNDVIFPKIATLEQDFTANKWTASQNQGVTRMGYSGFGTASLTVGREGSLLQIDIVANSLTQTFTIHFNSVLKTNSLSNSSSQVTSTVKIMSDDMTGDRIEQEIQKQIEIMLGIKREQGA
jgi:hypothetical protein